MSNKIMEFMTGFIGMGFKNVQMKRYNIKLSTKGITGQQGKNWAKHAARSNYARGIP